MTSKNERPSHRVMDEAIEQVKRVGRELSVAYTDYVVPFRKIDDQREPPKISMQD